MKQIYKKNKKAFYLMVISLFIILAMIVSTTYSYFQAQGNGSSSTDVNVTSETTDNLTFKTGEKLSINANQDNFAKTKGSLSSSTTASATLKARSDKSSTYYYDLTININSNEFTYTQEDETPELLVKVIGPDGEITENNGLSYKTITDVSGNEISGFDITNLNTAVKLVYNNEISAEAGETTTEEYTVIIYFVNLNADQEGNTGKTFDANLVIEKNYASSCDDYTLACNISKLSLTDTTNLADDDPNGNVRYIGGDSICTYNGKKVTSFDGSDVTEETCKKIYMMGYTSDYNLSSMYFDNSFENYFYNTDTVTWDTINNKCLTSSGVTVNKMSTREWTADICTGTAYEYQDTGQWFVEFSEAGAGTWDEKSVPNYVSFNDELWRVIGIFDTDDGTGNTEKRVKLIRSNSIGDYSWDYNSDGTYDNNWSDSTIMKLLNNGAYYNRTTGTYYNYSTTASNIDFSTIGLTNEAKTMIDNAKWNLGAVGIWGDKKILTSEFYIGERGIVTSPASNDASWIGKIGLLYPSDNGYATSGGETIKRKTCLKTSLNTYDYVNDWSGNQYLDCTNNNWLMQSQYTITPLLDKKNAVNSIYFSISPLLTQASVPIYPSVYLKSNINLTGGTGRLEDPYTISLSN